MQRSKSYALLFLLAAFVAGAALGFTADRVLERGKHGRGGRPSLDRMARELGLDSSQRSKFDSITTASRARMRELWKPMRPQMDSVGRLAKALGDSTHEELKRMLTPAQAVKLDEMRERGRRRSEARSRGNGDRDRHRQKTTPRP